VKITLLSVGSMKRSILAEPLADYTGRIARYLPFEMIEVRDAPASKKTTPVEASRTEGERILSRIRPGDYVVALDERGRGFTSNKFAKFLAARMNEGLKNVTFVVGGAWGLDPTVIERADLVLRLSDMIMPHELARVVCAEQVYRALTIIRGEPYSH